MYIQGLFKLKAQERDFVDFVVIFCLCLVTFLTKI